MAPFESDAEVYEAVAPFLAELVGDAGALASLRAADAVVQYALRRPEATLTFDARAGKSPQVVTGATDLVPDVVFQMDADTGRALLSGELHPMLALTRGEIRTKGPAAKVLAVLGAKPSGEPVPAEEAAPAADPAAAEEEAELAAEAGAPVEAAAEAAEGEPAEAGEAGSGEAAQDEPAAAEPGAGEPAQG